MTPIILNMSNASCVQVLLLQSRVLIPVVAVTGTETTGTSSDHINSQKQPFLRTSYPLLRTSYNATTPMPSSPTGGSSGHALEHYAFLMGIGERSVHGLRKRSSNSFEASNLSQATASLGLQQPLIPMPSALKAPEASTIKTANQPL